MTFLRSCIPPVLSAGLLFYSFVPEWGWILAHAALVPLWVSIFRGSARLFHVWLFGAAFAAAYFFWLNVFSPIAPVVLPFWHSVWIAAAFCPVMSASMRSRPWTAMLTGSALWILAEHLRSLGPYGYEWGSIGYTQYGNLRFAGWSNTGGMALVASFTLISNMILTQACLKKNVRWVAGLAAFWALIAAASPQPGLSRDISAAKNFVLLQTNVSPYAKSAEREEAVRSQMEILARQVFSTRAGVLILPETLFSTNITGTREVLLEEPRLMLAPLMQSHPNRRILVGAIEDGGHRTRGFYNAAVLIDAGGTRIASYRKRHLVPFGESIPWFEENRMARAFGQSLGTPFFSAGSETAPLLIGDATAPVRAAVLICFEGTFSRLVAESARGADILVNISNDAWSESVFGHEQHMRFLRFRAIETGLPVIRVGNSGPTALFAPDGRLIARIAHPAAAALELGGLNSDES